MIAASAISYGLPTGGTAKQIEYAADLLSQWRAACEVWISLMAQHAEAGSPRHAEILRRIHAAQEKALSLPAGRIIDCLADRDLVGTFAVSRFAARGVRNIEAI